MCGQCCGSAHLPLCVCTVGPAGYNIRQQAQRSTDALKTKNQDTNGETICWEQTFSRSIKKSFIVRSLCLLFLLHEEKFYKNRWWPLCSTQPPRGSVQRHWTLHFHSNWGMFTVAKREVVFHDARYYLWRKPCVCAVSLCPAVVASPSWNCELQSLGAYLRLPCGLLSFLPVRGKFRSTAWSRLAVEPEDLHPFHNQSSSLISSDKAALFNSESCAFFFFFWTPPIALNCAG